MVKLKVAARIQKPIHTLGGSAEEALTVIQRAVRWSQEESTFRNHTKRLVFGEPGATPSAPLSSSPTKHLVRSTATAHCLSSGNNLEAQC